MPASMMSAPSGLSPNVTGSSIAMVAIGPIPGSTPISVPTRQPNRQKPRLIGVAAAPKPVARLAKRSMSDGPDHEGLPQQLHEQYDAQHREPDGEPDHFPPGHTAAGK